MNNIDTKIKLPVAIQEVGRMVMSQLVVAFSFLSIYLPYCKLVSFWEEKWEVIDVSILVDGCR